MSRVKDKKQCRGKLCLETAETSIKDQQHILYNNLFTISSNCKTHNQTTTSTSFILQPFEDFLFSIGRQNREHKTRSIGQTGIKWRYELHACGAWLFPILVWPDAQQIGDLETHPEDLQSAINVCCLCSHNLEKKKKTL